MLLTRVKGNIIINSDLNIIYRSVQTVKTADGTKNLRKAGFKECILQVKKDMSI